MRGILSKLAYFIIIAATIPGCYSFKGGSVPEHLNTIYIAPVKDNSGYGNPSYRETLHQLLIDEFRRDGSFQIVESAGDAKLQAAITSISDATVQVNPGELETERKITLRVETEYYDAVKKETVWKKSFSNYGIYEIANALQGREDAINQSIEQTVQDILFDVVSNW